MYQTHPKRALKRSFNLVAVLVSASTFQYAIAESGCPTGFIPDGTEKLADSNFSNGYASFTTDVPFLSPIGTYPDDGNGSAFPTTGIGLMTGDFDPPGVVGQIAFPGDPTPAGGAAAVPAAATWFAYNGNNPGSPTKIWGQQLTGLTPNKDYAFTAYFSNALDPASQNIGLVAPAVSFQVNGAVVGNPVIAVCDGGGELDPVESDCVNAATVDQWNRLGVTVNPGAATTLDLSLHDGQIKSSSGNDFAMTLISFQECAPIGTPDISVTPASINFPAFTVGGTAVTSVVTVTNDGTGNLILGTVPAPANPKFTVQTDSCSGVSLTAGQTCTMTLAFSSATSGTETGSLSIPSNDPDENPVAVALSASTGLDSDNDGIPDADDIDDDNDGIKDTDEGTGDLDGDGIPNRLDLDSDNDGIPDIIEALGTDSNNDGRVDSFTDSNNDGYHDPLVAAPWAVPDTDGDSRRDFLDINSDNDAFFDSVEAGLPDNNNDGLVDNFSDPDGDGWDNGAKAVLGASGLPDEDNNGLPDYRQGLGEIITRIDGGLGSFGSMLFGLIGLAAVRRRKRLMVVTSILLLAVTSTAQAEKGQFYIGAGIGASQLEPEVVNLPITVDDTNDIGYKLFLGYDILDWLSLEGFASQLGAAGFSTGGEIDYATYGGSLVANLPNNTPGLSFLGKLGLAAIDNSSDNITFREVESQEIFAGLGAEYQFDNEFSVRGEYEYFDKDAQLLSLSLLKRFGGSKPVPPPAAVIPAPVAVAPVVVPPPPPAPVPVAVETIKLNIEPIFFDNDSHQLKTGAITRLNNVVELMNTYTDVDVMVIGHTDNRASDDYNMVLSLNRARSAVNYLKSQGISGDRLDHEARGEKYPAANNDTEEGRALNRRVEFFPTPDEVKQAQ